MSKTLIVIAGPTAIGKTALAIRLAQYYNTEIISADSRQFYREMNIGTAKPSEKELNSVKHHFINSHSIRDLFNVGDYEKAVIKLLESLFSDHKHVILAGGSGLFINVVCNGFDELPVASDETRNKLNTLLNEKGIEYLQNKLKQVDAVYFAEVDINNPQRLIRALEVYESTGKAFSHYRTNTIKNRPFNVIMIGLNTDRIKLYEQINSRVEQMIQNGLIEEVENLKSFRELNTLNSVGYTEILEYLDGKYSREAAIEKIKQNTRRFAKRQITWFKKSDEIKWFEPGEFDLILNYLNSKLLYPGPAEQKN